jgi:hypothetical protein
LIWIKVYFRGEPDDARRFGDGGFGSFSEVDARIGEVCCVEAEEE